MGIGSLRFSSQCKECLGWLLSAEESCCRRNKDECNRKSCSPPPPVSARSPGAPLMHPWKGQLCFPALCKFSVSTLGNSIALLRCGELLRGICGRINPPDETPFLQGYPRTSRHALLFAHHQPSCCPVCPAPLWPPALGWAPQHEGLLPKEGACSGMCPSGEHWTVTAPGERFPGVSKLQAPIPSPDAQLPLGLVLVPQPQP